MSKYSRYQMNLLKDLDECVSESLAILDQVRDKRLVVCFSGGKDSVVTEHLCKVAGVDYDTVYNVTTIDPPEVVKFIRKNYPDTIFSKPKESFYEKVKKHGSPSIKRRWCCTELKEYPLPNYDFKVMGIRSEESRKRQGRKIIDEKRNHVLPIYYWTEWHVWEYIETEKLSYPILYDKGFDRLGCVLCPFLSYKQHLRNMKMWPRMYKKLQETAAWWIENRRKNNDVSINADEWLDRYIKKKGMVDL